jgi:CheY-like chemotaxis protein
MDGAVLGPEALVLRFFGVPGNDRLLIVHLGRDLYLAPAPEPLLAPPEEGSYDLPVCALHMPELDGAGFYRALGQTHPHLLPRLIFLTGDTLTPEAQAFLAANGAPYLAKPCRTLEVRQMVQYTLQRLSETDCFPISHSRTDVSSSSLQVQGGSHG